MARNRDACNLDSAVQSISPSISRAGVTRDPSIAHHVGIVSVTRRQPLRTPSTQRADSRTCSHSCIYTRENQ